MRPTAVVVGGGLSGIAASLCLAATGWRVCLVEEAGGLALPWRSRAVFGRAFDLGIRVPAESGIAWADALMFHALPPSAQGALAWHRMPGLAREGHVFAGRASLDTGCLDATGLGRFVLGRIRDEVVHRRNRPDPAGAAGNFAARAAALYGPTLLGVALAPACRSLLGHAPEQLAWNGPQGRLPPRVVIAGQAETDLLRTRGRLADRLAHPSARALPSPASARAYLYPREGGIGAWVEALERQLAAHDVALHTRARVASLMLHADTVQGVTLGDGTQLPADLVAWTIRPDALPLPGLPKIPAVGCPVAARLLLLDRPVPHDLHWVASYDPATRFMRVGFPDALAGRPPSGAVPVLLETRVTRDAPPPDDGALLGELAAFGLVARDARVIGAAALGEGRFAVETVEAACARAALADALHPIRGLALLGAAGGGHHLVPDLVREAAGLAADLAAQAPPALPAPAFA